MCNAQVLAAPGLRAGELGWTVVSMKDDWATIF
jgi:hypothetical protein